MSHSGSCNGRKWRIQVYEKYSGQDAKIFDTTLKTRELFGEHCKELKTGLRPQKAVDLLEDFLFSHSTFDYENHAIFVNSKWFSFKGIGRGLRRIGEVFNQPLFVKEKNKGKY